MKSDKNFTFPLYNGKGLWYNAPMFIKGSDPKLQFRESEDVRLC